MNTNAVAAALTFGLLIPAALWFVSLGRPLENHALNRVARRRRQKAIAAYYRFNRGRVTADPSFKGAMRAAGELVHVQESLSAFPSLAAGLLKSKKNEWVVFGLEKNGVVNFVWFNRGGKVSVRPADGAYIQEWAKGSTTVLRFHNHPSGVMAPSQQDRLSAEYFSRVLNAGGFGFVDFVCCRGFWAQYRLAVADAVEPLNVHVEAVRAASARSRLATALLRLGATI